MDYERGSMVCAPHPPLRNSLCAYQLMAGGDCRTQKEVVGVLRHCPRVVPHGGGDLSPVQVHTLTLFCSLSCLRASLETLEKEALLDSMETR